MEQWEIGYKKREDEILRKIDNKEYLTEEEIKFLIDKDYVEEDLNVDKHRWCTHVDVVICIQNRFFKGFWMEGNTEIQENEYPKQKLKEVELVKKVIEVEEWEEIIKWTS